MKWLRVGVAIAVLMVPLSGLAQQAQGLPQTRQGSRPLGAELAKGVASPILSAAYFPLKFALGVTGAVLGGVSGFLTGGNERAAEGIWKPWTGGTYFITPAIIDGEKPFLPLDGGPYDPSQAPSGPAESGSLVPWGPNT